MAQNEFTMDIKIWDSWEVDTYSHLGYMEYMLVEIGIKLYLWEKPLND